MAVGVMCMRTFRGIKAGKSKLTLIKLLRVIATDIVSDQLYFIWELLCRKGIIFRDFRMGDPTLL